MHKTKVVPPESHAQASCGAWRGREAADTVDYKHPYLSMAQYAELLGDEAATKLIYLALRNITKRWKSPPVTWRAAATQFAIQFGERFNK